MLFTESLKLSFKVHHVLTRPLKNSLRLTPTHNTPLPTPMKVDSVILRLFNRQRNMFTC